MAKHGYHPNFADTGNVARHHVNPIVVKTLAKVGVRVPDKGGSVKVVLIMDGCAKRVGFHSKADAVRYAYGVRSIASAVWIEHAGLRLPIKGALVKDCATE